MAASARLNGSSEADFPSVEPDAHTVLIHLDLDAFYTQVEARLHGIDPQTPIAVSQWHSLIAVNYPARAKGIKKNMANAAAARAVCPDIRIVHVETLDENNVVSRGGSQATHKSSLRPYRSASRRIFRILTDIAGKDCVEKAGIDEAFADVGPLVDGLLATGVIAEAAGGSSSRGFLGIPSCADGASRDEVARAVVAAVGAQALRGRWCVIGSDGTQICAPASALLLASNDSCNDGMVTGPETLGDSASAPGQIVESSSTLPSVATADPSGTAFATSEATAAAAGRAPWIWSPEHILASWGGTAGPLAGISSPSGIRAAAGAVVAAWMRHRVWIAEGYTCSAGIAPTKVLAKLGSGRNKPNKQTIVLAASAREFMARTAISSVRSLGGNGGERLAAVVAQRHNIVGGDDDPVLVGAAQRLLGLQALRDHVTDGDANAALALYRRLRGVDDEALAPRQQIESMASSVTVDAPDRARALRWLRGAIAGELAQRAAEEAEEYAGRRPTKLTLVWSQQGGDGRGRSKVRVLPRTGVLTSDVLGGIAEALLNDVCREAGDERGSGRSTMPPITNLGLRLSGFDDGTLPPGQRAVDGYFRRQDTNPSLAEAQPDTIDSAFPGLESASRTLAQTYAAVGSGSSSADHCQAVTDAVVNHHASGVVAPASTAEISTSIERGAAEASGGRLKRGATVKRPRPQSDIRNLLLTAARGTMVTEIETVKLVAPPPGVVALTRGSAGGSSSAIIELLDSDDD